MNSQTDDLTRCIHELEDKALVLHAESSRSANTSNEKIQLLTLAIDRAADAFFLIDEAGHFVDVNQQACISLGYDRKELLKLGILDLDISMSRKGFQNICRTIAKHGDISVEGVFQRKDGTQFPVEQSIASGNLAGQLHIFTLVRDISERKQQERALQHSESKFRNIIDSAHDAIVGADSNWKIIIWNKQAEHLFGYSQSEAIGQPVNLIVPEHFSSFHETTSKSFATKAATLRPNRRLSGLHKDGHEMPVEINLSKFRDVDGQMMFSAIIRDMSEADLLERELRQAQKMEGIGTLVGGIAHDFNNMLAGMTGNLYLVSRERSLTTINQGRIDRVNDLCDRAASMIAQLLTFARKGVVQMESIPFVDFLEKALELTGLSIPKNIELVQELECDASENIFADRTQLQQLLLNLLINARDAIEGVSKPSICIRLQRVECNANLNDLHPGLAEGPWLRLSVIDNGCGISESVRENLFVPFFTTKEVGKGTGLGLSMVYGIVQSHHGAIEVESETDKGTAFHIYLPLEGTAPDKALLDDSAHEIPHGNGETILLVDDEEVVISITSALLSHLGYRVLTASNGREALAIEGVESIDLALLDVVMPEMGGEETAEVLRQMLPNLPVILATAYDHNQLSVSSKIMQNSQIISKPYRLHYLGRIIHEMLHG